MTLKKFDKEVILNPKFKEWDTIRNSENLSNYNTITNNDIKI